MKKSSYRHHSLNSARKYTLEIGRFGGVDYTTQKFLVSDGHAIDIKNFIYKDGVVQKRNGIEQLLKVADFEYIPADFDNPNQGTQDTAIENTKEINGVWVFDAEDNTQHIVAHIGSCLYEIVNLETDYAEAKPITLGVYKGEYLAYQFENYKSSAFVGGKKLWFLGGNKYMCLRFLSDGTLSLFPVENSDRTPVPTTTISITYKNSIVNNRQQLDNTNLLTEWRKNMLISGTSKVDSDTEFYEYTLDAPLIAKKTSDMANIEVTIKERGEVE